MYILAIRYRDRERFSDDSYGDYYWAKHLLYFKTLENAEKYRKDIRDRKIPAYSHIANTLIEIDKLETED